MGLFNVKIRNINWIWSKRYFADILRLYAGDDR